MRPEDFVNYTPRALEEEGSRRAAVLIPLLYTPEGIRILFQVRSGRVGHQPGDICFPGGMREEGETARENALRETREELLLLPEQIHLLGPTDYLVMGGLVVEPFLGVLTDYDPAAAPFNTHEVSEVFTVPLDFFLTHEPEVYTAEYHIELPDDFPYHRIQNGRDYGWRPRRESIYFWQVGDRTIWGMTARILRGILKDLKDLNDLYQVQIVHKD